MGFNLSGKWLHNFKTTYQYHNNMIEAYRSIYFFNPALHLSACSPVSHRGTWHSAQRLKPKSKAGRLSQEAPVFLASGRAAVWTADLSHLHWQTPALLHGAASSLFQGQLLLEIERGIPFKLPAAQLVLFWTAVIFQPRHESRTLTEWKRLRKLHGHQGIRTRQRRRYSGLIYGNVTRQNLNSYIYIYISGAKSI